jgi:hypothetical protein
MRVIAIPNVGKIRTVFCETVAISECGKRLICYSTSDGFNNVFILEHYKNVIIDDSNVKWYDMLTWDELKETYDILPQHIKDELAKSGRAPKQVKLVDDPCPCELSSEKKCLACQDLPSSYFDSLDYKNMTRNSEMKKNEVK